MWRRKEDNKIVEKGIIKKEKNEEGNVVLKKKIAPFL